MPPDWITPKTYVEYYRNRIRNQHRGFPYDDTNLKFPLPYQEYYRPVEADFSWYREKKNWWWFSIRVRNPIHLFEQLRDTSSFEGDLNGQIEGEPLPYYVSILNPLYKYKTVKLRKTFW